MNTKKNLLALSLVTIILFGCTKEENPDWDWEDVGTCGTPLNSTETKLEGLMWKLRSISTIDSLYDDSIFIKRRYLVFNGYCLSKNGRPTFYENNTGLSLKMVPNKIFGTSKDGEYKSPDTSHLKIVFYKDNSQDKALDSSLLKIMILTSTQLSLRDTISNIQWNFAR